MKGLKITTLSIAAAVSAGAANAQAGDRVAICPWQFTDGNQTSRTMVIDTIAKILNHNGYTAIVQDDVTASNQTNAPTVRMLNGAPDMGDLARYAQSVNAAHVVFGAMNWHTRSIWVGTGPKTISTSHLDLFIYNARSNQVEYQRRNIEGRSDEKESVLKDIGDVLVTPLITVVSGGPATPREQRAAQIAVARAIRPWIRHEDKHGRR